MATTAWTTEDELEYLDTIGENSKTCCMHTRKEMLQKYLNGFRQRRVWDDIDRKQVLTELVKMLKVER